MEIISETRQAYFCYTCSEEVTFRGTRIRYNLDGSLHLCKPEDKLAYEKYREYIRRDKTGWRLTGEDFWKWKREIYDVQRWTQSRDYYNELKEQRERDNRELLRQRPSKGVRLPRLKHNVGRQHRKLKSNDERNSASKQ
ncbi:MAG: hypothetical protein WCC17_12100 [Candidatus Nitrosopolaris sp.]